MQDISQISRYLKLNKKCSCGRTHSTSLLHVELSEGAHQTLPALLKIRGYKKIFLFGDANTFRVAGDEIASVLAHSGISAEQYILYDPLLIPDENAITALLHALPDDTDLIIAIGSGTINDLGKYISFKSKLPYYIVATAPSMDGFASNVSCLMLNHMKTTLETHIPEAIIGDLKVLSAAPKKMIAAGVGDILGKYICLLDWKLSHIINGEYHCSFVEDLVKNSINTIVGSIPLIRASNPAAIKTIMEGLILSGIAMSYTGNSRPASGSEHHLSHYWELNFIENSKPPVLHGIKVGIGTMQAAYLYEFLINSLDGSGYPDFAAARQHASAFSFDDWCRTMKQVYGSGADEVIALEQDCQKNSPEKVLERLNIIQDKWNEISETIKNYLPPADTIRSMLSDAGSDAKPEDEGITKDLVHDAVLYAKELRNRYGLLQLLYDLGYSQSFAERLVC